MSGSEQRDVHPSSEMPPAVLEPVMEALTLGVPAGREAEILAAAAEAIHALQDVDDPVQAMAHIRQAALRALAAEPQLASILGALEEWLEGARNVEALLGIAVSWALPAAALDVDAAAADARLFIDAYPFEGKVVGDLDARCARWLAQRLALVQGSPAAHLPAVRRAIGTLAEAVAGDFPTAAASIRGSEDEVDDERLWYELALLITRRELAAPRA